MPISVVGAGCDVRVLSRRHHEGADAIEFVTGDLATGERIETRGGWGRGDRALRRQRRGR
jgi:hypothetical protein